MVAMEIELCPRLSGRKRSIWEKLLGDAGLEADTQADTTLLVWDGDSLIATGSRLGNLLKCIAVAGDRQGEGFTATILTQLRQDALTAGHRHLFLYTKPQNKLQFSSLFFYPVAQTDSVLLMENTPRGIHAFLDTLPAPSAQDGITGAAVMNCNPFTLGHRYLIETAAKECDRLFVFVLSEDRSYFRTEDRTAMVKAGTADLKNVTVLPTGPYLISSATFPTYFLKDQSKAQTVQCQLDIAIFAKYYAPRFAITRRYVGTEPLCPITNQYNQALKDFLPDFGISLHEIPRMMQQDAPVSATAVRALLASGEAEQIRTLVPETTYEYLQKHALL